MTPGLMAVQVVQVPMPKDKRTKKDPNAVTITTFFKRSAATAADQRARAVASPRSTAPLQASKPARPEFQSQIEADEALLLHSIVS